MVKKGVIAIFAVMLVAGSLMIALGTQESSSLTHGSDSFVPSGTGRYVSPSLSINSSYVLSVLGSGAFVVNSSGIGIINNANAHVVGLAPARKLNLTNNTESIYANLPSGTYYVVYFPADSPQQANPIYSVQTDPGLANILSTVIVVGISVIIASFIVLAVGSFMGRDDRKN